MARVAGRECRLAGHGDAGTSTTISCNICHAGTVNWTSADKTKFSTRTSTGGTFDCTQAGCHAAGTNPVQDQTGSITDKTKHVNNSREVAFQTFTLKSKAQLRDASMPAGWTRVNSYKAAQNSYDSIAFDGGYVSATKKCTNVECHMRQEVTWNTHTLTCNSCHTDL